MVNGEPTNGASPSSPNWSVDLKAGDRVYADVRLASGVSAHRSRIDGRIAAKLADLCSIIADLERVLELCERLDAGGLDDLISSAVWEAAVVAYGRCFTNGRSSRGKGQRRQVPDDILESRSAELVQAHSRVMTDYRGQHVGHRISKEESVVIDALREDAEGPVIDLVAWTVRLQRPSDHHVLQSLAQDLLDRLRLLAQQEKNALMIDLNGD